MCGRSVEKKKTLMKTNNNNHNNNIHVHLKPRNSSQDTVHSKDRTPTHKLNSHFSKEPEEKTFSILYSSFTVFNSGALLLSALLKTTPNRTSIEVGVCWDALEMRLLPAVFTLCTALHFSQKISPFGAALVLRQGLWWERKIGCSDPWTAQHNGTD